jgi:hypothetical protein
VSPTPETLYGSMRTDELKALRAEIAPGTRRVELIDAILRERAKDESAPRYGVVADPRAGLVRVHFAGLPLTWLNLTPAEARELAAALTAKAGALERVRVEEDSP